MKYTDVRIERHAEPPVGGKPAMFHAKVVCTATTDGGFVTHDYPLWFGGDRDVDRLDDMAKRAMGDVLARGHVARI